MKNWILNLKIQYYCDIMVKNHEILEVKGE